MRSFAEALRLCAIAALCGWLIGCASAADGGPVGTGITASVAGNVVAVVTTSSAAQDAAVLDVPAVEVSIDEVAGAATTTDAEGNFALEGSFAGELTLRFRAPGVEATQAIEVPAGALVVLADVVVAPGEIDAEAGRQMGFFARVLATDCTAGVLVVEDDRMPPHEFIVQLLDETRLVRRNAGTIDCAEIGAGERVSIDGAFEPGAGATSGVTALAVTVGVERGERPEVFEDIPFLGFAAAIDCASGTLTVADANQRTRLRLTARTEFARRDGAAIACTEIGVGDRVSGLGRLRVRQPGLIEATSVVATTGQGAIEVRVSGAVAGKDCAAGVLQLDDGAAIAALVIVADTVIEPSLSCQEIPLGARVRGLGRVRRGVPDRIEAIRLRIRPPGTTR